MSDDRIARALARIAAASGRIERAAPGSSATDPELSHKYNNLQQEARQAIAAIDGLLDRLSA